MTSALNEHWWHDLAPDLQRVQMLHPLDREQIDSELQVGGRHPLSKQRIADIVQRAVASSVTPALESEAASHCSSCRRVAEEMSSAGLIASDMIETLPELETQPNGDNLDPYAFAKRLAQQAGVAAKAEHPASGDILGDYLLLREVGQGGMGKVFRALHLRMDRVVAVKVLGAKQQRDRQSRRFKDEIKTLAKLDHSHIVKAFDAGEDGGVLYLVMEFVDGADLSRLVARLGPLSVGLALNHLLQAAEGLHYAHQQGIVHRDVKPSNLLVDNQGVVRISDLGLARRHLPDQQLAGQDRTEPGAAVGTFSYMSPEQVEGRKADSRSDIYGLGGALFYLLTGRPPAEGSNHQKAQWHLRGVVPSLRTHRADVSEALDQAFRKMLAKNPDHRQQTMAEVIDQLQVCRERLHDPHPSPRLPAQQKGWFWGVALVALVLVGVSLGNFEWRPNPPPNSPEGSQPTAASALQAFVDGDAAQPKLVNSIDMTLMRIPAGQFQMGAPETEPDSAEDERPQRLVQFEHAFYMGACEVTRREFYQVMQQPDPEAPAAVEPDVPSIDPGQLPMTNVTWEQAVEFCRRLSELPLEARNGHKYRLPTEAEWEYSCRAGTTAAFYTGEDITEEQANFGNQFQLANTKFPNHPGLFEVGSFKPNTFGLFDMHGNALEHCQDRYGDYHPEPTVDPLGPKEGPHHVLRGGATTYQKSECRSANRLFQRPNQTNQYTGFRVVCVPQSS